MSKYEQTMWAQVIDTELSEKPIFIRVNILNKTPPKRSVADEHHIIQSTEHQRKWTYPAPLSLQVQLILSFHPQLFESIDKMFSPVSPS